MRLLLILFCLSACGLTNAQSSLPAFGEFTQQEKELKECPFDKNAEAIVLLDDAVADHDDDRRLITHRRIRIKILNQREVDRGNIRIRFYSKDDFEYIENIRGVTYNEEGGQFTLSYLEKKSIFTEKEDNILSTVKFAMPNVKPGSIIEYEYDSYMKHYGGLNAWIFQHDIPTIKSCYLLTLLPNTEFQYNVQKKRNYPIIVKPFRDIGKVYFEMNNLPGLKFEPYMDAVNDYLQKVEFQLATYYDRYGKIKINQTWKDLGNDLWNDKEFGSAIKKDISKTDDVKNIVAKETTEQGKAAAIYNYVRNNFTWNGYYSKYASEGLKKVWEKRSGNAGEINLLLINLLQSFDIEVSPLLVAERDFGKIDTTYPFIDRFNKVVAYVMAGGRRFIMDATEKFTPPELTPYPLLNTIAFVVEKKNYRLIRISNNIKFYNNIISIDAKVDNSGMLKGTSEITSSDYAKQIRTEKIRTDQKKFIRDVLQEPGSELVIDNFTYDNLGDDEKPLLQKIDFHSELNVSGGFVFLNCNLFMGLGKNPFTSSERFTNINFGYPYNIKLEAKVQLPEKSVADKLPADKTVTSSDQAITLTRKFKIENNTLFATIEFVQNTTLVSYEQYDNLKFFYKQIVDLLNIPVVVKISQ